MIMLAPTRAALPVATAGVIAVANLESLRQRSWQVLGRLPARRGTAEQIIDAEGLRLQFLGDLTALDRLVSLAATLCQAMPKTAETHLVAARVASMRHEFDAAGFHVANARALGADADAADRIELTIRQARGDRAAEVLDARRRLAKDNPCPQELVPLGALLADLGQFDAAEQIYLRALDACTDVSPFPLAWACFQLGVLFGETTPGRDAGQAATWYRRAVEYLPDYTHARVHLAEIHLEEGQLDRAESLLLPIEAGGDPEACWRLADVRAARGMRAEADRSLAAVKSTFETLVARHELAFADHAAAFYLETGLNPVRALELARVNLANRPTARAFKLAHAAAVATGDMEYQRLCSAQALDRWQVALDSTGSALPRTSRPPEDGFPA